MIRKNPRGDLPDIHPSAFVDPTATRPAPADTSVRFATRRSVEQVEEGRELATKLDRDGLIAWVTTDAATGEVLMLGYMNEEALRCTIQTGEAHCNTPNPTIL